MVGNSKVTLDKLFNLLEPQSSLAKGDRNACLAMFS